MAYYRKGEKVLLVFGNFQNEPQQMKLPSNIKKILLNNMESLDQSGLVLQLAGYQFLIVEL